MERDDASVCGFEETDWLCDLRTLLAPSTWSRAWLEEAAVVAERGRWRLRLEAVVGGIGEGCRRWLVVGERKGEEPLRDSTMEWAALLAMSRGGQPGPGASQARAICGA